MRTRKIASTAVTWYHLDNDDVQLFVFDFLLFLVEAKGFVIFTENQLSLGEILLFIGRSYVGRFKIERIWVMVSPRFRRFMRSENQATSWRVEKIAVSRNEGVVGHMVHGVRLLQG